MKFTKTLELEDYNLIANQVNELKSTQHYCTNNSIPFSLNHTHRYWEYGMALKAFENWMLEKSATNTPSIIDIGAGTGLLGPTLSWQHNLAVTESEPDVGCFQPRSILNNWLYRDKKPIIQLRTEIPETHFDVVFCISVIEHVAADHDFLKKISDLVKPNGLLFMTTDIMPKMPKEDGKGYVSDNIREHNFVIKDLQRMKDYFESKDFISFGEVDFEFHGVMVNDYTFGSLCVTKN